MQHDSSGYWKATLGLLTKILIVWFVVSFGAGILFADLLNGIKLGGYPLGFWFAHQGSMYIFIILIFFNSLLDIFFYLINRIFIELIFYFLIQSLIEFH